MIEVKIVKDSTNWLSSRLTTMVLSYPRYIHSELMTHRVFSRNASSTRAIPYNTFKETTKKEFFYPIWTFNQKGMQGKIIDELETINSANEIWENIYGLISPELDKLYQLGIHKQNINRLMEPYQCIKVLVTSTNWSNFLNLRNHKDAQPEIQELAKKIDKALKENEPEYLKPGQWHVPFDGHHIIDLSSDKKVFGLEESLKISVARCARISYNSVNGSSSTLERDMELFDKLISANPKHLSPTEHQACVPKEDQLDGFNCYYTKKFNSGNPEWKYVKGPFHSNLEGWIQYRKLIENDLSIKDFTLWV